MITKINRRQALRAGMFGGIGLLAAACIPQSDAARTQSETETQKPSVDGASSAVRPTALAQADSTYSANAVVPVAPNPSVSGAVESPETVSTMANAANQYLGILDDAQRAKTTYAFADAERLRWHWTNTSAFPRNGLPLREMQPNQREAALAFLRSGLSEAGFKKSMDIIQLQPEIGGDPDNYYVTVFGKPGVATWGWRFEGHHLSRHFTIAGNRITVTPFFHGVWPTISTAGKTIMQREEWAARELVTSLDTAKRGEVIFQANAPGRHLTWNENFVKPLDPVGAPLSTLNNDQQALAMEIIQIWLGTQAEPVAKAQLARINGSGRDSIRFAWAGAIEERRPHYYRLQGPSFLLEHDNTRNGSTHIHSVWRLFDQDFGQNVA